jgi:hypothetical protein
MDDYPYFGMDRTSTIRPHITPSDVLEIWSAEFDMAYEEGGMFLLTMHPQIIGHRSRIAMLEELIQYIRSKPGVWFATHEEVARAAAELLSAGIDPADAANQLGHSAEMFLRVYSEWIDGYAKNKDKSRFDIGSLTGHRPGKKELI